MAGAVIRFGAHTRMTVEQALAEASSREWDQVLICGFDKDDELISISSQMTREQALWLLEHAKLWSMGRL